MRDLSQVPAFKGIASTPLGKPSLHSGEYCKPP